MPTARMTARCCEALGWLIPTIGGEPADLDGPAREAVEDPEATRMGQRPQDPGLEIVDVVHDQSIDSCAHAHQCRPGGPPRAEPPADCTRLREPGAVGRA